jgi:hypothetical protein
MKHLASVRPAAEQPKGFFLGLDLGQAADYTALVVIERVGHAPPYGRPQKAAGSFRKEHVKPDTPRREVA